MKFGLIPGEQIRRLSLPQPPTQVTYPDGLTHNVIQRDIIYNGHSLSYFDVNRVQGWFKVPNNVRIFTYSIPGNVLSMSESELPIDICINNNIAKHVVLIYEPGDRMPQVETSVIEQIDSVLGSYRQMNPYYAICSKDPNRDFLNMYQPRIELKTLPFIKNDHIFFSNFVFMIARDHTKFNDIHLLTCQSYPERPGLTPGKFQLPAELAAFSIESGIQDPGYTGSYSQQLNLKRPKLKQQNPWVIPPSNEFKRTRILPTFLSSSLGNTQTLSTQDPGFSGFHGISFSGFQGQGFVEQTNIFEQTSRLNTIDEYVRQNINDLNTYGARPFYNLLFEKLNLQVNKENLNDIRNAIDKYQTFNFGTSFNKDIKYLKGLKG
jgi:hypothetical protein